MLATEREGVNERGIGAFHVEHCCMEKTKSGPCHRATGAPVAHGVGPVGSASRRAPKSCARRGPCAPPHPAASRHSGTSMLTSPLAQILFPDGVARVGTRRRAN